MRSSDIKQDMNINDPEANNGRSSRDAVEASSSGDGMGGGVVAEVVGPHQHGWVLDERMKRMLMDLQRHWLSDHQQSREKLLVEMTEKLHQEFLSDQQKIRTELLTQFKEELDTTRSDLEQKYRDSLKTEVNKISDKFRREISANKKEAMVLAM